MKNKDLKEKRLIELLHICTQLGYKLTFTNDFEGMLTLGYQDEHDDSTYNHAHLGSPGEKLDNLERDLRGILNTLIEKETK